MAESTINTFDDITERLDEIIATVRSKETSLERSLDLFDEAIKLGSRAVDMVDTFELSPREADELAQQMDDDASADTGDAETTSDEVGE
ncbi:exodeoxyribonuclease VII small subunit [Collinsella tanakaei]|uniref:exodeoxyribonuclease VII small subunit n=1 Tax=Collinsella tanakaei TaxID=626935 RepID=UPI001F447E49|nr:exodeoxyribonuclease VII small subunit [Collinsella tanakaei]MCF2620773.1 exodeoxyribonuclease VII small subunit [Collinsella tanakaei]